MRLLIIEDEEDLALALKRGLEKSGYIADVALDGEDGLAQALIGSYDLIILDLNLPRLDGMAVLEAIRRQVPQQRVLILSARSTYEQRIAGLDGGASDYLCKPFDLGELMARVRSLLRRSYIQQAACLIAWGFCFDTVARTVAAPSGELMALPPKELAIFEYLMLNQGRPVSAERIIEHVWQDDDALFSNTVKVHISTLRKKLATHCGRDIIAWTRGGYMIVEEEPS